MFNTVILGLGNILLKDEGVGVYAAKELKKSTLPEDVEVIDGGTSPTVFLTVKDARKIIIIDALKGGKEPGTIYRLSPENLTTGSYSNTLSLHQMSLVETLSIIEKTGSTFKNIVIIGVEPEKIEWGVGLTPAIEQKIPDIINITLKEVSNACHGKKTAA